MEQDATLRPTEETEYWTPKEAASYLGISRRLLDKLDIPFFRYSRKTIRYLARDVRAFREESQSKQ